MFKLGGRADRFRAHVAVDPAYDGEEFCRFKVFDGDAFSNKLLWASGKMTKESGSKEIDIALDQVDRLRWYLKETTIGKLGGCTSEHCRKPVAGRTRCIQLVNGGREV